MLALLSYALLDGMLVSKHGLATLERAVIFLGFSEAGRVPSQRGAAGAHPLQRYDRAVGPLNRLMLRIAYNHARDLHSAVDGISASDEAVIGELLLVIAPPPIQPGKNA
jgi:hypothetical protein